MTAVRLLVDVDVVVRRGEGEDRVRARHALCGTAVHAARASADGTLRHATFDVGDWQQQLADLCRVAAPRASTAPPEPDLSVPWDLVLGTGAALDHRRPDLYDVLAGQADGAVRAGSGRLSSAATHDQLRRLHRAVIGRLRCTGTAPAARRLGWVSWLLYADGWRALTPYAEPTGGARPMVRLEPRVPDDLAHDVARWAVAA